MQAFLVANISSRLNGFHEKYGSKLEAVGDEHKIKRERFLELSDRAVAARGHEMDGRQHAIPIINNP